jgi:hydrogenase expression/formation protein HypD
VVQNQGNRVALSAIKQVFELRDQFEWRGLGEIAQGGLKLRDEYSNFDAEKKFTLPNQRVKDHKACQCGEILKGVLKPWECKVFWYCLYSRNIPSVLVWFLVKVLVPLIINMVEISKFFY